MSLWKKYVILLFLFVSNSYALNCRSERGTKEDDFRRVFNNCVKQMERNSSRHSSEDWKERDHKQRNQWEKESRNENRNGRMGNDDSDLGERSKNWDNRDSENERYGKRQNRGNMNDNRGNRMGDRYNRTSGRNNRMSMNGEDSGNSRSRNEMMNGRNDQISGRNDFLPPEDSDVTNRQHHDYYPAAQSSRRYKREKRIEMNSGKRSQYNPHSQTSNNENKDKRNSTDNSTKEVDRACILHCFLQNLHMTDDSGMPDRYLVTHAFIRDEKNEDLQDFIQESIEECFQILDNENTDDKCEFSKNLLTCLTEKGRSNCDNWSEKTSYLFE